MKVLCSDDEEKYFMRMINHKPLWKDRSKKAPDTVSNGACLVPLHSLSSYHLWMRRNMLLFPMSDEYVYVSGCNLILERFSNKKQVIIPLKSDCNVTSIYWQESSTNERLLLIGEKVFPNDHHKYCSGRVEIINLDCTLLPPKIILDHSIYAAYDSYIYDCIMPYHSDICLTLLKRISMEEPQTKIFVWNYQSVTLLDIEDFKINLEGIVRNPRRGTSFLLFDIYYAAIWDYNDSKKKMVLSVEFYDKNCEEITDAEFIRDKNFYGVMISFRSEWFEIIKLTEDPEDKNKQTAEVYLRIDLFSIFDPNWVDMRELNPEESIARRKEMSINDNFIPFDTINFTPNFGLEKPTVSETKNFIKYIISRDKYILIFLENSPVVTILELCDCEGETKIKVSSIDKIEHPIKSKASIAINSKLTKMLLIVGESQNSFYNLLANKRMEMAIRSNVKHDTIRKVKESMFSLKEVTMSYYKYKINFVDNSPNFVFEEQLLQNTGNGFPVKRVLISETPRMLMINAGQDELDIFIYKQLHSGPDKVFSLSKNYENDISVFIQSQTQFYKEQISFEFFLHYRLLDKPICIAFNPRGKQFFVSYKEGGYLYAIIGNEVREVFKVTLYCKACAFSQTGTYLAFATSEYDNEYNINIYNVSTNSFEWVIEKVPLPIKFVFYDRDSIFCALFNDNATNFVAWRLSWSERLIKNTSSLNKEKEESDSSVLIKISDFSGNINDFIYDHLFDHCLITSGDKRVRIYNGYKDEKHWEFLTDVEYHCVLFIKKIDTVFFGTSIGSIRSILWPIPNMTKDSTIEHPDYSEVFLHTGKITAMEMSTDNKFLYSSGEDGSVFVTCVYAMSNEVPVTAKSFIYFAPINFIPKTMHFHYSDVMIVTDALYQTKLDALKKKKAAIQSRISEFTSKKEKLIQSNASELDRKRTELTDILEEKVKAVKEKGNEKEKETKKLKEEREMQIKSIKEQLSSLKNSFKKQKEIKQLETTKLISCIKVAKEKFNTRISDLDAVRAVTNTKISGCLESIHQILKDKKADIEKMINEKTNKFKDECEKSEDKYELDIRSKERNFKALVTEYETRQKETDIEIMKKNKDNKNYKEKISEWEHHLKELKVNNDELMETFLMNKLKLYQMNQLLSDNESKISAKEKIVKEKRLVNDRLEQLRFVLEYQIKNLILEKTPIEEQIKNFESLHSDFYKRFNLLYAELLNISELIENNQKCIVTYRDELSDTKKNLYQLKNLYKSIDIALNSILKSKLENKKTILGEIFDVYKTYLSNLNVGNKQNKVMSAEMKLQNKNIEKEIYHQKNNVLKELIDKRSERRKINKEKEEMMKDIRLDNQLLIQECSNIRENLEDILKNINDIEKKFIELTNNNTFLNDDINAVDIKGKIKHAKQNILLHDDEKTKIFKGINNCPPIDDRRNSEADVSVKEEENVNMNKIVSPNDLVKKQQENIIEMKAQTEEVEKMQKKLKELVGDASMPKFAKEREQNLTEVYHNMSKGKISHISESSRNKNMANSRNVSIKTNKYYDSQRGGIK